MLLQLIFITFVVRTAEISQFHAFFLCFFAHFGNFSLVSCGACDKFSFSSVVVSLSMSQTRGSCGHIKGNYDNHSSCLNCTGCFRSSCCSVCLLWPDSTWSLVSKRRRFSDRRKVGRTKEEKAKAKKKKDSASRDPSGSRSHLEKTVVRTDPTGSTADGRDDDNASALSVSSSGGERVRGDTGVPGSRSSHGTPGPSPRGQRAHSSTPARSHSGDLAGKYGVQASAKDFEATLLDPNPAPGDSNQVTLSKDRSPRSESKCPVERSNSGDIGKNARLAKNGSVQQTSGIQQEVVEQRPVFSGPGAGLIPGTRYRDPVSRTRCAQPRLVNRVL